MEYRNLGKSGLKVSRVSFGSWLTFGSQIGDKVANELLTYAYDQGINFFDNAEVYAHGRSEIAMGKILKAKSWPRDSYIVSSKAFFGAVPDGVPTQVGLHRKHLVEACNDALKRLQVEYLDLYFCHRPDKETPIEETVWTMHNLIVQGKILYWGTSEWSAQEIMAAHMFARQNNLIGPIVEQPEYNMLHRHKVEVEYSQIYKTVGLGTTTWSPLASGILTGKYTGGVTDDTRLTIPNNEWLKDARLTEEDVEKAHLLSSIAKEIGITMPQLAISWCLKNDDVSTVILGASKLEQLKENIKAQDYVDRLTEEVIDRVEAILDNKPQQPLF
jgi:voltage-dependent potassium channel beta subunit